MARKKGVKAYARKAKARKAMRVCTAVRGPPCFVPCDDWSDLLVPRKPVLSNVILNELHNLGKGDHVSVIKMEEGDIMHAYMVYYLTLYGTDDNMFQGYIYGKDGKEVVTFGVDRIHSITRVGTHKDRRQSGDRQRHEAGEP